MKRGGDFRTADEAAVYPEADARALVRRLDMYVRGAFARGLVEQAVHEPDDGRGPGLRLAHVAEAFARGGNFMRRASGGFAGAALHSVIGDGGALQVATRRYAHLRLASRDEPYLVRRLHVERVGHCDGYFPACRGERHDAQPRSNAFGNQRERLLRRMNFVKRQKRQA